MVEMQSCDLFGGQDNGTNDNYPPRAEPYIVLRPGKNNNYYSVLLQKEFMPSFLVPFQLLFLNGRVDK